MMKSLLGIVFFMTALGAASAQAYREYTGEVCTATITVRNATIEFTASPAFLFKSSISAIEIHIFIFALDPVSESSPGWMAWHLPCSRRAMCDDSISLQTS
jgi:hypothetical protein